MRDEFGVTIFDKAIFVAIGYAPLENVKYVFKNLMRYYDQEMVDGGIKILFTEKKFDIIDWLISENITSYNTNYIQRKETKEKGTKTEALMEGEKGTMMNMLKDLEQKIKNIK